MSYENQKYKMKLICIVTYILALLIPSLAFSQDFTATTVGDYGNISVMAVTGNYDAENPDGSVNDIPRQEIAKEFFRTHKDEYDFLVTDKGSNLDIGHNDRGITIEGTKREAGNRWPDH